MTADTLLTFPCDFSIKVIGKNTSLFAHEILLITQKHFADVTAAALQLNPSKNANYLAITITVLATDKVTLDALYGDLTKHPDSKMVL